MHRKRTSFRWLFKLLFWCVVAGLVYWGVDYCYRTVQKWREPHYITVQSQQEAMDKMSSLLKLWGGSDEELTDAASNWEVQTAWMKSPEARLAVSRLLADELENRGLLVQARILRTTLMTQELASSGKLSSSDRKRVLAHTLDKADSMFLQGDKEHAGLLYHAVIRTGTPSEGEVVLRATDSLVCLENSRGAKEDVLKAIETLKGKIDFNSLNSPAAIRKAVRLLLLSDKILKETSDGQTSIQGRELARDLLEKGKLTTSPEWGIISLQDIKAALKDPDPAEIPSLVRTLEEALICFRSPEQEEVRYTPEVMLAIASLKLKSDQLESANLWVGRAEGSALTLGVDTPRILDGRSIREDVATLRTEYRNLMERKTALKEVKDSLDSGAKKLANGLWDDAISEAGKTSVLAGKIGTFVDGYIPASLMQVASAYEGKKKWEEASSVYADLLKSWDALDENVSKAAETNLSRLKYPDFYKTVVRRLAAAYRKLDMVTRAREVLKRIGEGGTSEDVPSGQERNRTRTR